MPRTVAEKMGVRAGGRAHLVNAPRGSSGRWNCRISTSRRTCAGCRLPPPVLCPGRRAGRRFPRLKRHLRPTGALWVSWPKGRKLGADLTLPTVIEIGYRHGLVESTTLRVDDTWSAMKFTHPKAGRVYRNSYGTLPADDSPTWSAGVSASSQRQTAPSSPSGSSAARRKPDLRSSAVDAFSAARVWAVTVTTSAERARSTSTDTARLAMPRPCRAGATA